MSLLDAVSSMWASEDRRKKALDLSSKLTAQETFALDYLKSEALKAVEIDGVKNEGRSDHSRSKLEMGYAELIELCAFAIGPADALPYMPGEMRAEKINAVSRELGVSVVAITHFAIMGSAGIRRVLEGV